MREVPLTQGYVALVDDADFDRVMQSKWNARVQNRGRTVYAMRSGRVGGKVIKPTRMHRFIMDAPDGVEVDHRDGDGLHNTRDNLRFATHAQNRANNRLYRNSTSGFKGVSWSTSHKRWQVHLCVNGKRMCLGFFDDKEEGARVYDAAALEHFGSFARLNFPEEAVDVPRR